MADDIVEWLSDTEKWLSHVRSGACGVDQLDWGCVGLVEASGADQLGQRRVACVGFDQRAHAWMGPLVGLFDRWLGRLVHHLDQPRAHHPQTKVQPPNWAPHATLVATVFCALQQLTCYNKSCCIISLDHTLQCSRDTTPSPATVKSQTLEMTEWSRNNVWQNHKNDWGKLKNDWLNHKNVESL
jgi:hypothetical protein